MAIVTVIGAGLAGSEAAWQIARAGIDVELIEMRPAVMSPAHHTPLFAELVCSNSLRGAGLENAVGLLKEEMRQLKSLVMQAADATRVPAGGALAVDRTLFGEYITNALESHPRVRIRREEVTELPDGRPLIIATGPLTSPALSQVIGEMAGQEYLYFYDAAAPIVTAESLDMNKVYRASRYGKGDEDYLNCPMDRDEYLRFQQELVAAEGTPTREFEKAVFFEGCMPIEVMAARGVDTMRYGPLKPVGLDHPETGVRPYAVVQLRQENSEASLYNIVGFQTHLKWPEQKRVFSVIPGLEQAEFARYGVMHRNTFINSPQLLKPTLQMQTREDVFFAGQITGVEGYVESAASGLIAGINAARYASDKELLIFPQETAHGAMCRYITEAVAKHFQPMNVNYGLLPPLAQKIRDKREKYRQLAERALTELKKFIEKCDNNIA
ncbi:MAG TPA: methylenetetrahydrofolate--tRNA-(uracil(54)-C(5))-methyltransferase (FADH(2)-oxidizing) TrmFO [Patescibacteria group bacterium]|nr:methylenetetrahydrofolate--tRNA-(uracil(54)-C(5))-methyltransferase (FADH(2)-oxidizing) TrmFO [Patescibacteria group bacterium]